MIVCPIKVDMVYVIPVWARPQELLGNQLVNIAGCALATPKKYNNGVSRPPYPSL